jgi:hypothetical protein
LKIPSRTRPQTLSATGIRVEDAFICHHYEHLGVLEPDFRRRPASGSSLLQNHWAPVNQPASHKLHRYPPLIIAHAISVCIRFLICFRRVEMLLTERGITVPYETNRHWVKKFEDE